MADGNGTSVGKIFLDLIVRNTVDKQVENIATQAQNTTQKAFAGMEKAAESMVNKATASAAQTAQKASAAVSQNVNKSVALAQSRVNELERSYERITKKLTDAKWAYSYNEDGDKSNDKFVERLAAQQEAVYDRLESSRERLAIHARAAAEKQAATEAAAAQKAAQAAEVAAAKQQEAVSQAHTAADPPAAKHQLSIWQRLTSLADRFRNTASKAFSGAGRYANGFTGKISSLTKRLSIADKTAGRFGTRLRGILYSAFVFNGLSAGLRSVTSYFAKAVTASDGMKDALANLKGAAANAASPLIQVLTPALSALANTAATVFSYVSKLLTLLTGKISKAASTASKSASAAKKATATLAGFDEITRLDSNDSSGGSDSGTVEPNYNFEGQSKFLDSVLAAVEAGQWKQVGALFSQKLNDSLASIKWPSIQEKARSWSQNIVDTLNGFVGNLNWGLVGSTIGNGLNTALLFVNTFFRGFNWQGLGEGIGTGLNDLFATLNWEDLGSVLAGKFKAIFDTLYGFVQTFEFDALGSNLSTMIVSAFGSIDWAKAGQGVSDGIIGVATTITTCLEELDWQEIGRNVETFLGNVDWSGIVSVITEGIGAAVGGLAALLWEIIGDEWNSMIDTWLENTEKCGGNIVAGLLLSIIEGLANIGKWIVDNIFTPFIDGFNKAFGIHSPSTVMEEQGGYIISGLLSGITNAWKSVPKFFGTALTDIGNKISGAFTVLKTKVADIWKNGIVPAIKGPINSIISCINGMISGIVSGMNSVIRALNKLSFTVPDWVPELGGKSFGFNIKTITAPQIPQLANGGVITQPTLAMMGEYAGAGSNPEIVAPQSIIEETVAAAMEDMTNGMMAGFEATVAILKEILEAIYGIEIGDEVIAKAVARYNSKMAVVKGGG